MVSVISVVALISTNPAAQSAVWIFGGLDFPKAKLANPNVHLSLGISGPFVLVWLLWLCSASQPCAGSSMVKVCWLRLGVSHNRVGMEGFIRSNGFWQVVCISRSTYGLK